MAASYRGKAVVPASASWRGRRVGAVLAATAIAVWWSVGAEAQAPPAPEQTSARTSQANAEAIALLKRMHTYIRSSTDTDFRTTFSLTTDIHGLGKEGSVHFQTRQPNLLRIELTVGKMRTVFVSDGRMLYINRPAQGRYAEVLAAESLVGTMYKGAGMLSLHARVLDFLWTVDYLLTLGETVRVTARGADSIGGRECRHLLVERMDDVWDVWVEDSATPLPCKLVSRRLDDPADPVQTNELSWIIAPNLPDALFTFTPPPGVKKVYPADLD
ncbi:MAG: DUF2092 domain-containing protein [Pseudomonadota bacterium]